MKEFKINVEETLRRTVTVYAEDIDDALTKVKNVYSKGEVILDSDDLSHVTFLPLPNFKNNSK